MRLNSAKAIETANRVYELYGSWQAVRKASMLIDGVYVIQPKSIDSKPLTDKGSQK